MEPEIDHIELQHAEEFSSGRIATADVDEASRPEAALAPVDGGFGAWSFLAAAFVIETLSWGFPDAYGVFLAAYLKDPRLAQQRNAQSLLPLIGVLCSGIQFCVGPLIFPFFTRHPRIRRPSAWIGTFVCFASLFAASYTTNIWGLLLLQGVMYAAGGSCLYTVCIVLMSEWFVARKGLANAVMMAGTAMGGVILPLILPFLMEKFGIANTLRIVSIGIGVSLICVLPFIRGRLPESRVHGPGARRLMDPAWKSSPTFWALMCANTIQSLAYFVPIVWLPTFASALDISPTKGSLSVVLLQGCTVVGRLSSGVGVDMMARRRSIDTPGPWVIASASFVCAAISVFVGWGLFANTLAGIIAFSCFYGALAGGWTSLWTGFIRPLANDDPTLTTNLFGLLLITRGIGNVLGTPIATALTRYGAGSPSNVATGFKVDAGRYQGVIIFVGASFLAAAAMAAVGWTVDKRARR